MKSKLIPVVLSLTLALTPMAAFGAGKPGQEVEHVEEVEDKEETEKEETEEVEEKETVEESYKILIGTVKEVFKAEISDVGVEDIRDTDNMLGLGQVRVRVILENGSEADFVINADTYITSGKDSILELANKEDLEDIKVFAFYNANAPMTMIYPAQYNAVAVGIVEEKAVLPAVAVFDEKMLAVDNSIKLNMNEEVVVVNKFDDVYEESIVGKLLLVEYTVSTKSLPPQTTPEKVVVLDELVKEEVVEEETEEVLELDYANLVYVVEGEVIEAPVAYESENGFTMVPLRAIAEALDLEVKWDAVSSSVVIGHATLSIDKDYYTFAKMAPIELGQAPELTDGLTYVPLQFFKEVLQLNNAYVFEGQIEINNGEIME